MEFAYNLEDWSTVRVEQSYSLEGCYFKLQTLLKLRLTDTIPANIEVEASLSEQCTKSKTSCCLYKLPTFLNKYLWHFFSSFKDLKRFKQTSHNPNYGWIYEHTYTQLFGLVFAEEQGPWKCCRTRSVAPCQFTISLSIYTKNRERKYMVH